MGACLGPSAWRQRVWRLAALLLVAGHCWYFFPKVKSLTAEQSSSFSGFFAAGHWIKQHSTPDTLLWAGSPRLIRYTTGLQLAEFGGRIQSFPSHPETWKEIVSRTRAPVLLAVDAWERRQPSWIYPLTQAKIHFLTESGFQLVKTVRAVCEDPSHCPTAIWIFLKPATTAKE